MAYLYDMLKKIRFSPLLIIAICLFGLGLFFTFVGGNLGPLVGIITIVIGMLCLAPYYILKWIFPTNVWRQVAVELLLLLIVCCVIFKLTENVILRPHGYQGYVYVVYETNKETPVSRPGLFGHNAYIEVPSSGIIFTNEGYNSRFAGIAVDEASGKLITPGYDLPYAYDTVRCVGKSYTAAVVLVGKRPVNWQYKTDTAARNAKKMQAYDLLTAPK